MFQGGRNDLQGNDNDDDFGFDDEIEGDDPPQNSTTVVEPEKTKSRAWIFWVVLGLLGFIGAIYLTSISLQGGLDSTTPVVVSPSPTLLVAGQAIQSVMVTPAPSMVPTEAPPNGPNGNALSEAKGTAQRESDQAAATSTTAAANTAATSDAAVLFAAQTIVAEAASPTTVVVPSQVSIGAETRQAAMTATATVKTIPTATAIPAQAAVAAPTSVGLQSGECRLFPEKELPNNTGNAQVYETPNGVFIGRLTMGDTYTPEIRAVQQSTGGQWVLIHVQSVYSSAAAQSIGEINGWVRLSDINCNLKGVPQQAAPTLAASTRAANSPALPSPTIDSAGSFSG